MTLFMIIAMLMLGSCCEIAVCSKIIDLSSELPSSLNWFDFRQRVGRVFVSRANISASSLIIKTDSSLTFEVQTNGNKALLTSSGTSFAWNSVDIRLTLALHAEGLQTVTAKGSCSVQLDGNCLASSFDIFSEDSAVVRVPSKIPSETKRISITSSSIGGVFFDNLNHSILPQIYADQKNAGRIVVGGVDRVEAAHLSASKGGQICISGDNTQFGELVSTVSGSGNIGIRSAGKGPATGSAVLSISGAGRISVCSGIPFENAKVDITFSGVIDVASNGLTGEIMGTGNINYVDTDPFSSSEVSVPITGSLSEMSSCPTYEVCRWTNPPVSIWNPNGVDHSFRASLIFSILASTISLALNR